MASGGPAFVEGDQFPQSSVELGGIGRRFGHTMFHVILQKLRFERAEGGMDGADGVQDFGAFAILRDHPSDSLNLAGNPVHPPEQRLRLVAIAIHEDTYRGYV